MAHSQDTLYRRETANLLASLDTPLLDLQSLAVTLADDEDPTVRVRAVQALGAIKQAQLIPTLLAKLGDRHAGKAAIAALASYGAEALPGLETRLADLRAGDSVRLQAAEALGAIGSPEAASVLLSRLVESAAPVRGALFKALADIACKGPIQSLPEAELDTQTIAEVRAAYKLYVMREDLDEDEPGSLLHEALTVRLEGVMDRIVDLLTVRYGARIETVRAAIASPDTHRRAQAIELLDNIVAAPIRDRLIPLLDAPAAQVIETARTRFSLARRSRAELLAEMAEGSDAWLRMCALHQSADLKKSSGGQTAAAILKYGALTSEDGERMAISTVERVLVLKRVPLFAGISGEGLVPIAQLAQEVRFNAGDIIIRQGDPGDCVYVTVSGRTGITAAGVGQVAVREAPTVLGELALILSQPRSAGCMALSDIVALRIDSAPFQELLSQQPEIAKGVIRVLAEWLAEAQMGIRKQDAPYSSLAGVSVEQTLSKQ